MPSTEAPTPEGRLLLVSNRLPITIKRTDEGEYDTSMSSGGLVTGLSGLSKSTKFMWYGWPGIEVPEDEIEKLKTQLKNDYDAVPVMLDEDVADKHYNGFSSQWQGL
jgi:trehalose 6-phosphate synthase